MATPSLIGLVQDTFAFALVFVFPMVDLPATNRLKQQSTSAGRLAFYRRNIVFIWAALAVAIALVGLDRLWILPRQTDEMAWLSRSTWIYAIVLTATVAYAALGLLPGIQSLGSQSARLKCTNALKPLRFMMPVTQLERRWWIVASLTAGICEELLFRGFLIHYLRGDLQGGGAPQPNACMAIGFHRIWDLPRLSGFKGRHRNDHRGNSIRHAGDTDWEPASARYFSLLNRHAVACHVPANPRCARGSG